MASDIPESAAETAREFRDGVRDFARSETAGLRFLEGLQEASVGEGETVPPEPPFTEGDVDALQPKGVEEEFEDLSEIQEEDVGEIGDEGSFGSPPCPDGFTWNPVEERCVEDPPDDIDEISTRPCPNGFEWDPVEETCVKKQPDTAPEMPFAVDTDDDEDEGSIVSDPLGAIFGGD